MCKCRLKTEKAGSDAVIFLFGGYKQVCTKHNREFYSSNKKGCCALNEAEWLACNKKRG